MWTADLPPVKWVAKEHIAVLGAGLMGHSIAYVFAANGHLVSVTDPDPGALASLNNRVDGIFELLEQDRTGAGTGTVIAAKSFNDAVADADIVIEAAPEKLELKQSIFDQLIKETKPGCILASNTSGLPIGQIAAKAAEPERIVGTHFWNPPHLVPLVEVIQGAKTSLSVVEKMIKILTALGKTAVHAKRDIPGFIGNRMQHALKREAIALVESGVCDAETVDLVVKEGFGQRLSVMGPLENSDLVGLNLTLDIHEFLLSDLDASETPQRLLRDKVMAGELGMSTGKGFRSWTPTQAENARTSMQNHLVQAAKDRLKKRKN